MSMDFVRATDELLRRVTLDDLAKAAGKSVQTFKQARLALGETGRRSPPEGWEEVVAGMARRQARRLTNLANALAPTK